jgi:hypothetical protein
MPYILNNITNFYIAINLLIIIYKCNMKPLIKKVAYEYLIGIKYIFFIVNFFI